MNLKRCLNHFCFNLLIPKFITLLCIAVCMPILSLAQIAENTAGDSTRQKFTHDIGLGAGFTTGVGLTYRVWHRKVGAQLAGGALNTGDYEIYSLGFSYLLALQANSMNRFFVYQGNHFISLVEYFPASTQYYYTNGIATFSNTQPARTEVNRYLNNGIGFGYEFFENEGKPSQFGFSLQAGLASYRSFTRANFTGEVPFMFRFK